MKRTGLFLALAIAMTGCQTAEPEDGGQVSSEVFGIDARIDGRADGQLPSSRTTFTPPGEVAWDSDDRIAALVYDSGDWSAHRLDRAAQGEGRFSAADGYVLTATAASVHAIYPYSSSITALDGDGFTDAPVIIGSAADGSQVQNGTGEEAAAHIEAPLYGYSEISTGGGAAVSMDMHHASSLIEVLVRNSTGHDADVTEITVSNGASRNLTGEFFINPGTGELKAGDNVSASASLDVEGAVLASGQTASFYVTVAPFELSAESFTVSVVADGRTYNFSKTVTKKFEAGVRNWTEVLDLTDDGGAFALSSTSVEYDFFSDPEPAQVTLEAVNMPEGATMLSWSTSDSYVVRVDDNGSLTPVGHGVATVTATANDPDASTATCTVRVNGVKDRNYGNGDSYYDKCYLPVNVTVTDADGAQVVQTWLDRNLGASRVTTTYDDYESYGSSFQWSRKADGHEKLTWTSRVYAIRVNEYIETVLADRENAKSDKFIVTGDVGGDWVRDADTDAYGLWGGGNAAGDGIDTGYAAGLDTPGQANNPCPEGYRIPSSDELYMMIGTMLGVGELTASYNEATTGALNTLAECPLHFPASGYGNNATNGRMSSAAGAVGLWCNTSSLDNTLARRVHVQDTRIQTGTAVRSRSYAVRCIRDIPLETVSLD